MNSFEYQPLNTYREYHPWVKIDTPPIQEQKIILGSFPIWSLTKHEFDKNDQSHFISKRIEKTGEFPFFYGSSVNRFWSWYQTYIDRDIELLNFISLKQSLKRNQIGISDTILSCIRKKKSALDKDLTKRIYNHQFFKYPEQGKITKILCTSKGVMNDMLLNKKFFEYHSEIKIDVQSSQKLQKDFINYIRGNQQLINNPIFSQLSIKGGGIIQCLALPSPGSPYRRLNDFGLYKEKAYIYLENYIQSAFHWFK